MSKHVTVDLGAVEYRIEEIRDILRGQSAHLNDISNAISSLEGALPLTPFDQLDEISATLKAINETLKEIVINMPT